MLAEKMTLNFEKEVVVRLIGYHVWGPSIPVRFPSFIFPFYAPEANGCRCLDDVLKVGAGCFRCEIGSCGARVRVEPFCMLIWNWSLVCWSLKILGTFRVRLWYVVAGLLSCWGGPPGIRKEFQNNRWLSEMVSGERARCRPKS